MNNTHSSAGAPSVKPFDEAYEALFDTDSYGSHQLEMSLPGAVTTWMAAFGNSAESKEQLLSDLESLFDWFTQNPWTPPEALPLRHKRKSAPWSSAKRYRIIADLVERDGWDCHYCPTTLTMKTVTIDHVHPQSMGGSHELENLVLACQVCNSRKGAKILGEVADS